MSKQKHIGDGKSIIKYFFTEIQIGERKKVQGIKLYKFKSKSPEIWVLMWPITAQDQTFSAPRLSNVEIFSLSQNHKEVHMIRIYMWLHQKQELIV